MDNKDTSTSSTIPMPYVGTAIKKAMPMPISSFPGTPNAYGTFDNDLTPLPTATRVGTLSTIKYTGKMPLQIQTTQTGPVASVQQTSGMGILQKFK